jgi:hypothetical protein
MAGVIGGASGACAYFPKCAAVIAFIGGIVAIYTGIMSWMNSRCDNRGVNLHFFMGFIPAGGGVYPWFAC